MSQYDVFDNPVPRARRAFPLVVVIQSELADTGREIMVAPLVPRAHMQNAVGRLTPIVKAMGADHVLLVPRMASVPTADLRELKDRIDSHRDAIVAALDLLFLGV